MVRETEILNKLHSLSDPSRARHAQRFFKTGLGEYAEGDVFLGIRVPELRRLARQHKDLTLHTLLICLQSKYHEVRLFSLICLIGQYNKGDKKNQQNIFSLYKKHKSFVNNWDLVDTSAPTICGAHLWDKDRQIIYRWARSTNLWHRRIAIMTTFYFIKQGDFKDTLSIANFLLNDKEDLIHKAVGWMLREIANRDIAVAEKFLLPVYKSIPRMMLRYAIEKYPQDRRKAFLQGNL